MGLRRKGGRVSNPSSISVSSPSIRSYAGTSRSDAFSSNRTHCWSYKRDTIRETQCVTGCDSFQTSLLHWQLTSSLQNARLDHGKGRLIKGLSHTKPDLSSIKRVLDRLVSFKLASSEIQPVVILEYFPLKKIQSIPNGTCAFQRPKFNSGVLVMTWKNNTLENLKLARSIACELGDIVALGQQKYIGQVEQGYGNYGTWVY